MAHGFAGERAFGLEPFAERFANAGVSVFLFDYRNFGDSSGEPRNLVDPFRHLQDWRAAIAHVRAMKSVDTGRIALWGTSFSGGHVIMAAATDGGIRAICAQIPFVDPISSFRSVGIKFIIKGAVLGTWDLIKSAFGLPPFSIPIVASPETFAALNTPDSFRGYTRLIPEGASWQNICPARIFVTMSFYHPIHYAPKVRCPALIIMADQDNLIDPRAVLKTSQKMSKAKLIRFPVGHFDIYTGEIFEKVVHKEILFLKEHLL